MLMMSELERIRGCAWPDIPWHMRARAWLPTWLGGVPLCVQVREAGLFTDPRDLLEYLHVELLRASLKPASQDCTPVLVQVIRQVRWQLRVQGLRDGEHFKPGVEAALKAEFERVERIGWRGS